MLEVLGGFAVVLATLGVSGFAIGVWQIARWWRAGPGPEAE